MKGPGPTLDDDAKADLFLDAKLLLHPAERLLEIIATSCRRAQTTHGGRRHLPMNRKAPDLLVALVEDAVAIGSAVLAVARI